MSINTDGWVSLPGPDGADGLHLRIRLRGDGRFTITDLYLHAPEITSKELRDISMARLEAAVNVGGRPDLAVGLARELGFLQEAEDLDAGAAETAKSLYGFAGQGGIVLYGGGEQSEPSLAELRGRVPTSRPKRSRRRRKPLTRPDGTDVDGFYRRVAEAYQEYVPQTKAPATDIAAEADVPLTTAHRWIREARRRGFLPPARKGRAG
jgi:hypothetical protein